MLCSSDIRNSNSDHIWRKWVFKINYKMLVRGTRSGCSKKDWKNDFTKIYLMKLSYYHKKFKLHSELPKITWHIYILLTVRNFLVISPPSPDLVKQAEDSLSKGYPWQISIDTRSLISIAFFWDKILLSELLSYMVAQKTLRESFTESHRNTEWLILQSYNHLIMKM